MDVQLQTHTSLETAQDLGPAIETYADQVMAEFRDGLDTSGIGADVLRRAVEEPEGCLVTAHGGDGARIGFAVAVPLVDPLLGDRIPIIVALWTEPEFRHRGLAGQMVQAVRRDLAERGIPVLAGRAGHNDDALISMGERWGFVRAWELMVHE